jgi:hypothetical protein
VLKLFADYGKGGAFEAAFQQRFDAPPPEELTTGHRLTIIASAVDVATERIVEYLVDEYKVPVNVVFFRYFEDQGHRYLERTWLIDQDRAPEPTGGSTSKAKEPWNGRDWYVSFGEFPDGRRWEDAVKYGFVSAGGGEWYSRSIRKLPTRARIFTHIPQAGYEHRQPITRDALRARLRRLQPGRLRAAAPASIWSSRSFSSECQRIC